MLTRAEKEDRVIQMYDQGIVYREIAKEVHMSLGDISSIVKRHTGEIQSQGNLEQKQPQQKTIDAKAFTLFEAGRTPVQAAIELDLKADDVISLNREWWQLKGLDDLNRAYEEIGNNIFSLNALHKSTVKAGMSQQQVINALCIAEQLPIVETRFRTLRDDVNRMEFQKWSAQRDLYDLNNQVAAARTTLNSVTTQVRLGHEQMVKVNNERQQVETFIARLKADGKEYQRVRVTVCQVLNDKPLIVYAALVSILQALKEDNETQALIYDILDAPGNIFLLTHLGLDPRTIKAHHRNRKSER